MTSDALTGNRTQSVRYELIKTSVREVFGWVEQEPIPSTADEDFEDATLIDQLYGGDLGTGWVRTNSVAGHGGSWSLTNENIVDESAYFFIDVTNAVEVTFWWRGHASNAALDYFVVRDAPGEITNGTILFGDSSLDITTETWTEQNIDVTGLETIMIRYIDNAVGGANRIYIDDITIDIETPVDPVWTLVDTVQEEASANDLDGVTGGSLDFVANASIKGGGSITIVDRGQDIDWLNDRIKIYYTVDGYGETALGVFLFSEAPESWSDTGRTYAVKLLDKNTILDQDAVEENTLVASGTVVTDQVATYLSNQNQAVTPSTATLAGPQTWEPGTSYLRIINDLLATIGYFSMFPNGDGQFIVKPYVLPASRPIVWEFLDGENCIYIPDFTNDVDLFSIPNRFIAVGQGDGDTAALVSTYTNTDPDSPYSTVSRGRTIVAVETGIEAADQTTLDNYARRRLVELTSPTQSIEIQHAYVPGLTVNDAVWFRSQTAGIDARHVVTKTVIPLDPTALCTTTLQKVVDL